MSYAITVIPVEELVDQYCPIVANKLNFLMDLQEFVGISYKTMYEKAEGGRLYGASVRATRGYYVSKNELEGLINIARNLLLALKEFTNLHMEDTKKYRKAMQILIDKAYFSEKSTFKKNNIAKVDRWTLFKLSTQLNDICFRYDKLFIDNPF